MNQSPTEHLGEAAPIAFIAHEITSSILDSLKSDLALSLGLNFNLGFKAKAPLMAHLGPRWKSF